MEDFATFFRELVRTFGGNKQQLAAAVGISPSRVSRLLNGRDTDGPSTELCLRIAAATGAPAARVLRIAGKGAIADLIEELFGKSAERQQAFGFRVAPYEQKILADLRRVGVSERRALALILEELARLGGPTELSSTGPPPKARRDGTGG